MSVTNKKDNAYYSWRSGAKDDIYLDTAKQEEYPRKRATSVGRDPKLLKGLSMPWEPIVKKTAAVKNVSAKTDRPITPNLSVDTPTMTTDASPSSATSGMAAARALESQQRCHPEANNGDNKTSHPIDVSAPPLSSTPATSPRASPKMKTPNSGMNPAAQPFGTTQGSEQSPMPSPKPSHASTDSDTDPAGGVLLSDFDQDRGYPSPPHPPHSIPMAPKLGQGLENLIAYGSNTPPPPGHPFPVMFMPSLPPAPEPVWYNPAHIIDHRGLLHPDLPMSVTPPHQLGVPFAVPGVPHMSSPSSPSYDSGSTAVNSSSSSPRFRKAAGAAARAAAKAAAAAAAAGMPTHHPGPEHRRAAHSPSGEAPSPAGSSGGTCRHWAHHAKCAFGEQCKHAHRMPRREDLGRVGLVSYPGWYMESAFSLYSLLHWCRGSVVQYLRQYEPAMMTALEQIHAKIAGDADAPPLPDVSFSVPEPETPTPPPAPRQDCFGTAGPVPGGVDSRPWMYKNGGHHSTEQPGSCPPYRGKAIKPARRWGPQFGGWKQGPQGNHYRSYDIMEGAKRKGRTSQAAAKRNQGGMVMVGF